METIIRGKVWVGGDDIDAYQILPERRWVDDSRDLQDFGLWALEDADTAFRDKPWALRDSGAAIIVAGRNYGGGGKSIETPVYAVMGAGIKVVLADSFARFNFRNSINNGLPVLVCRGLNEKVRTGDSITVNMEEGSVVIDATGEKLEIVPLSSFARELLECGGYVNYIKKKMKDDR